ncbi:MAG: DUF2993 domain-containing protein [Potamolinea sp.]
MELVTILLSALLAVLSPVGIVTDKIVANAVRSRLSKVEQLQVRIDNAPSYQLVQGKVEKVRIAGRGLWLTPDVRIGALEVETDPINLDLQRLRQSGQNSAREALRQPLQAAVRVVLTEADLNKILQSPAVTSRMSVFGSRAFGGAPERYQFLNPKIEFLGNKRFRFQVEMREKDAEPLAIMVESGLGITAGRSFQLIEPVISLNGKPLSSALIAAFSGGISNGFNLRSLEERGITARILQLNTNNRELEIAAFVRTDASGKR